MPGFPPKPRRGDILTYDGQGWVPSSAGPGISFSFFDNAFVVRDNLDPTKAFSFEAAGITAGTTRTLGVPDASGTLALLSLAQTFSANQTFSARALLTGGNAATGPATGDLQTTGGASIGQSLYIANQLVAGDAVGLASTTTPLHYLVATNNDDKPAVEIRQGRFAKDVLTLTCNQVLGAFLFKAIENGTTRFSVYGDGTTSITCLTDATSPTAAALTCSGGLGIAKRSHLGTIGGTFAGNVLAGVQDGTAAVAGQVGETSTSTISTPQNAAATGTYLALTSLTLPPGDWLISGWVESIPNGGTLTVDGPTELVIGTTSASAAGSVAGFDRATENHPIVGGVRHQIVIPAKRVNISASTTYYANVLATFTLGTPQWVGSISATRMR